MRSPMMIAGLAYIVRAHVERVQVDTTYIHREEEEGKKNTTPRMYANENVRGTRYVAICRNGTRFRYLPIIPPADLLSRRGGEGTMSGGGWGEGEAIALQTSVLDVGHNRAAATSVSVHNRRACNREKRPRFSRVPK